MPTTDAPISTKKAADLLGENVRQVIRRVERGELTPVFKGEGIRGAYVFNQADIESLKTAPTVSAGPQATSPGDGGGSPTSDAA